MLKAYLSVQASSLSAFAISKTHTSGQKPRGRQLNTKVAVMKVLFFLFFLIFLLRPRCSTTISGKRFIYSSSFQHETDPYHNEELYNQSASSTSPWSIKAIHNTVAAVRCEGRHFVILCACAQVVSFPYQILR